MTDPADSIREDPTEVPAGLLFHSGHTYVRIISADLAFVGATRFAVGFVGSIGQVLRPPEYHRLSSGELAWTLVSRAGRKLVQTSPVGGRVLVVNKDLLDDPGRLENSTYQRGWVLCIQSPNLQGSLADLLPLEPDRLWLDHTLKVMEGILGDEGNLLFPDGTWRPGFGDGFSVQQWEALRHRLFPVTRHQSLHVNSNH